MNKFLLDIVEKELKVFYFKAFKRRSKSLETLELIKECYLDQIDLFNNYLEKLFKSFKENKSKSLLVEDLIKFKNYEGCNKKIMKSIVSEIKKIDESVDFDSDETKDLFEFDD
ncbi:MAG: hypothetical protein CL838_02075 [Crocinitomicaceae bacterium]|nr:hypothetical protein [Crocinitomicaceae bacterium]